MTNQKQKLKSTIKLMKNKSSTAIILKSGKKKVSDKEIIQTLIQSNGNLIKTYENLKLNDIRFFIYCQENRDIQNVITCLKSKKSIEYEQHMEDLAYSQNPVTAFQATKFLLSHLNPQYADKPQIMQEISTNSDGNVNIKQIFGLPED